MFIPNTAAMEMENITQTTGKVPMSYGRERYPDAPLVFPIGREVGKQTQFVTLAGEELYLNTLVSGGKGKGKTAGIIKPFLRWVICHPQRPGALIYDVKGDLVSYIVQWAREVGREEDVVIIDPKGDFKVRLLPGNLSPDTIASIVISAAGAISGGHDPREAFWIQHGEELIKFLVLLIKMKAGDMDYPVSPSEINNIVAVDDEIHRLVNLVEVRAGNGDFNSPEQRHNVDFLVRYKKQHTELDPRVKTSIEAEVRRFFQAFSGFDFARVFCPKKDEKCVNIADIINEGKMVVLNMPSSLYAESSRFVGLLLKGQFYNTVGQRMLDGSGLDRERPVFFVCDEYQNFVTLGGKVGADDQFSALCRYARAGMMCATQELGALYSVAGARSEDTVANLVQNFQNNVLLRQDLTPRLKILLEGKGLGDLECLPKLQSYEALLFKDTDPTARLVELGPYYSNWNYVTGENERTVQELRKGKQSILTRRGLINDKEEGQTKVIIAGEHSMGKTKLLEDIYREHCLLSPCIMVCGRADLSERPINLISELAKACAFSRVKMQEASIFVDDIDALTASLGKMNNGLYVGLLPFLEGRKVQYGKHLDLADLSKVSIIATATWSRGEARIGFVNNARCLKKTVLPGIVRGVCRVVDIADLTSDKQIMKSAVLKEACREK